MHAQLNSTRLAHAVGVFMMALASPASFTTASAADLATPPDGTIFGVDISPDGRAYAILKQYGDQRAVAFYDADDASKPPTGVGLGDIETGSFAWGGDGHVLIEAFGEQGGIDTTKGLKTIRVGRWLSVDADDGAVVTLFGENQIGDDYLYIVEEAGMLVSTLSTCKKSISESAQ